MSFTHDEYVLAILGLSMSFSAAQYLEAILGLEAEFAFEDAFPHATPLQGRPCDIIRRRLC